MAVIAMTREMATLGKDVAEGLAARLGLTIVHHELVEQDIAQRAGLPESEVHRFLEGETPLLQKWKIDSKRLSRYTAQGILARRARQNSHPRLGRDASPMSVPHAICVRISCLWYSKRKSLWNALASPIHVWLDERLSEAMLLTTTRCAGCFGIHWQDPGLYTLALNTARVSVDDCVEQITRLAQSPAFLETAASKLSLQDHIVLARVRDALDRRFGPGINALGIEEHVSKGHVTLTGAMSDERPMVECVRLVRDVTGVVSVESKIAYIAFRPPSTE